MEQKLRKITEQAIDFIQKKAPDDFEITLGESVGTTTSVRLGKIEELQRHTDCDFQITVLFGKKKGRATTADLSVKSIFQAIDAACTIARFTEDDPFLSLAPKEKMAWDVPKLALYYPAEMNAEAAAKMALECEAGGLAHKLIDNSEGAELTVRRNVELYANSHGLVQTHQTTEYALGAALIARRKDEMQSAYEYDLKLNLKDLQNPEHIGRMAAKRAAEKLGARKIPTTHCPVLFTPRLAAGLVRQWLGALGGTRQYQKRSFLLDRLGALVAAENLHIVENPLQPKTFGARAFDRDGVLKSKQFFIRGGRVENYVLGQYSANRLGLKTTANAGGLCNVCVLPTTENGADEILKTMDKGFFATELMGHGINETTGDYSRGAAGFWIENGKIVHPVAGVAIAGNLKEMLMHIAALGADIDPRLNIKTGALLIEQMAVSGQ